MKKVIFIVVASIFLSGCFQVVALVGPAATGSVTSGKIYQSAVSYGLSYGVKKTTGKTVIENVVSLSKAHQQKAKTVKNSKSDILINSLNPKHF